jgi:hypothetical protein
VLWRKKKSFVTNGSDAIHKENMRQFEQFLIFFHPCAFFNQFYYLAHRPLNIQLDFYLRLFILVAM